MLESVDLGGKDPVVLGHAMHHYQPWTVGTRLAHDFEMFRHAAMVPQSLGIENYPYAPLCGAYIQFRIISNVLILSQPIASKLASIKTAIG